MCIKHNSVVQDEMQDKYRMAYFLSKKIILSCPPVCHYLSNMFDTRQAQLHEVLVFFTLISIKDSADWWTSWRVHCKNYKCQIFQQKYLSTWVYYRMLSKIASYVTRNNLTIWWKKPSNILTLQYSERDPNFIKLSYYPYRKSHCGDKMYNRRPIL